MFSDRALHRVRWFVGTLTADKVMVVEQEGVADWGQCPPHAGRSTPWGALHGFSLYANMRSLLMVFISALKGRLFASQSM